MQPLLLFAALATLTSASLLTHLLPAISQSTTNTSTPTHLTDTLCHIYTTMDHQAVRLLLTANLPNREYVELMADLFAGRPVGELAVFLGDKEEVIYEYRMGMGVEVERLLKGVGGDVEERMNVIRPELYQLEKRLLDNLVNQSHYLPKVHHIYQILSTSFPTTPTLPTSPKKSHARRFPRPPKKHGIPAYFYYVVLVILIACFLVALARRESKRALSVFEEHPPNPSQSGHRHSVSLQEQIQRPAQGFNPYRVEMVSTSEAPPAYTPR